MRKSLELHFLVVGLVDFLELLMFINGFLPYILINEENRGPGHGKHFV